MSKESTKKLGIAPLSLTVDEHTKLEKVQAFLHLTTKKSHTKPQACEYLVRVGIGVVEKEMDRFIKE